MLSILPFIDKEIAKKPWKTKVYSTRKNGSIFSDDVDITVESEDIMWNYNGSQFYFRILGLWILLNPIKYTKACVLMYPFGETYPGGLIVG